MGIVNVTPDSFSDGGAAAGRRRARWTRRVQMVEDGADLLDVGGESTRPGAQPLSAKREERRAGACR